MEAIPVGGRNRVSLFCVGLNISGNYTTKPATWNRQRNKNQNDLNQEQEIFCLEVMVLLMGKCPNCGKKQLLLETLDCIVCEKEGCNNCFRFLFRIIEKRGGSGELDKWFVCSDKCLDKLAKEIENQISPSDVPADTWDQIPPIHFLTEKAILNANNSRLLGKIVEKIKKGEELHIYFSEVFVPSSFLSAIGEKEDKVSIPANPLWNRLFRYTSMLKARHFEILREYENAAKVYKALGMYEEAGKARDRRDEIRVKKTEVSVNLDALLEQIKNGGITAVYRCPHCGGKLKIGKNTSVETLKVCEHCGSEIQTMDLAGFLKTVLS